MVLCFAADCSHKTPSVCKMFRMPSDESEFAKWSSLLSGRTDRKPEKTSRVCSCHFKDGLKENGPTIFQYNRNKSLNYVSPEKLTRKKRKLLSEEEPSENTATVSGTKNPQPSTSGSFVTGLITPPDDSSLHMDDPAETDSEILLLREKILSLEKELDMAKTEQKFSIMQIKNNNELINLYTGLPDGETFAALFKYLSKFNFKYYFGWRVTTMPQEDQLLLTLIKLRLNLPHLDLAQRFGYSASTVSNIFLTWLHLIHQTVYKRFQSKQPSSSKIKTCLPNAFSAFSNCKIILDCTELKIQVPEKMEQQKDTFSQYKHANTYKALVGVAPNGVITFASDLFPGSKSDRQIYIESGINEQLEPGDLILVDKGFLIHDVVPAGVVVNMPPFLMKEQFSKEEAIGPMNIARCRIHVERANARIKRYRILNMIPASLKQFASIVFQVCTSLVNLQNPLLREIERKLDP